MPRFLDFPSNELFHRTCSSTEHISTKNRHLFPQHAAVEMLVGRQPLLSLILL